MTQTEANQIQQMIQQCKTYPHATQYDKGDAVLTEQGLKIVEIFIKGLVK